jgi:DNA transposition AAA+ family ATPase
MLPQQSTFGISPAHTRENRAARWFLRLANFVFAEIAEDTVNVVDTVNTEKIMQLRYCANWGGRGGGVLGISGVIRATQKRRISQIRALTTYIRIDTAHTAKANVVIVISNPAFFSEQAPSTPVRQPCQTA